MSSKRQPGNPNSKGGNKRKLMLNDLVRRTESRRLVADTPAKKIREFKRKRN